MDDAVRLTPQHREGGPLLGSNEAGDSQALRTMLSDGLHFTGQGYRVFWEVVKKEVGKAWESEPWDNPHWIWPQ